MGLDRRRSLCRGASRCVWELTRAVLQTSCDLLHLTEYLKGTFRFPYPPLVQSRTYRGGSAIRRCGVEIVRNSTLFSEVFLLTRNFISGPDAQGSPVFSGNDGTKFAKKLNSFFWSADFTDTTNALASLAPLRRAEGLRVASSRTKEDDRGA
jgi:hypothetical protein